MSTTSDVGTASGHADLVARAEHLSRDYAFTAVRDWKERTGGIAIGYMPVYVPRELLWAQRALPVGILGGGDDLEIIRGDAYYQSYICHIPRSTIELGLNGSLDCLEGVLFPATCDVIRNLSGMWKMQFPDKLVRYLDVPQDFDPEMGGAFYRQELEEVSEGLVRVGGRPYDADALREAIGVFNENRRAVADDPAAAAQAWFSENLAAHSASSLRFAAQAARMAMHERFFADLRVVERLYLDELMKTEDAVEGIRAFLGKRPPSWRNR